MAYPFAQFPTFAEFRKRLEQEFDCTFKTLQVADYPDPIVYFERRVGGETVYIAVDPVPDDTRIDPHVIRSVCARLQINPEEFGLHLG